jgi:hypothetical protein
MDLKNNKMQNNLQGNYANCFKAPGPWAEFSTLGASICDMLTCKTKQSSLNFKTQHKIFRFSPVRFQSPRIS